MDSVEVKPLKPAYPTINQRRMLVELLAADEIIRRGFPPKKGPLQDAYELRWQIIADKLNNANGPQRSVIQWKCTWANIKRRARIIAPTYMQETSDEVRNSFVEIISPKIRLNCSDKKNRGAHPRLTYKIKQENTHEVHNKSVEEIHPTTHQETESQSSPHSFNQTDDDTSQPNKETSVQGYRSIGDCCRQLIRNIANSIHENKTENKVISSMSVDKNAYYKLQKIWSNMKTLAIAKLNYLFDANDLEYTLAEEYRMSIMDWLLFDTVLVHQDVDVIGTASKPFQDKPELRSLFELAVLYNVDKLAGDELASAWSTITLLYNDNKRTCTPMLLQRRWYQMKLATRIRFYSTYKASKRDMQLVNIDMPTRLQIEIVNWNNSLLTKPFVTWDDLVKNNRVISRTQFELIALKRKLNKSIISASAANVAIVNSDIGSQSNKTPLKIIHNNNVPCSDTTTEVVISEENELAPRDNANNLNPVNLIPIIDTNQASSVIETIQMEQNVEMLPKITNVFGNVHVTNETLSKICDIAAQIKNKSVSNSVVKEPEHKIMNTKDTCKDEDITILSHQITPGATINSGPSTVFGKISNEVNSISELLIIPETRTWFGEVSNDVDNIPKTLSIPRPSTAFGEVSNDVNSIPESLSIPGLITSFGKTTNDVEDILKSFIVRRPPSASSGEVSNDVDNIPKTLSIPGPSTAFGELSNDVGSIPESPTILGPPSTSFGEVSNDGDNIIPESLTILRSSTLFGEISNDVELADDGIELDEMMSDTEDILKKIDEVISPSKAENHEANSEDSWDEHISTKYKDLLNVPIVYTVKLDDMGILPINLLTHVNNKSIIDIIDFKSKPILKRTSRKTNGEKLKLSSYLFKKPRIRTYPKEKLRINPDFNTFLLPLKFFERQHTRALYRLCKPLTVDVSKAFEKHLVNGIMYLGRTHDDELHEKMTLIAKCIASIDDSCQKDVDNTICSSEQKHNTTCVRSKVINLQDISEVREINKQLLTAQVMPQQVIKDHPKFSDTSTKTNSDFLKLYPRSLDEVLEDVCKQLSAILPEPNSLYNDNTPEISDNHISDPLLSLEELNSLLLLLSIFNDDNNENNTGNANSDEISYKGCSSDELIYNLPNNDTTDNLYTPIIQACYVLNNDNRNNIDNPESYQISLKDHNMDNLVHNTLNNTNRKKIQNRQLNNNTRKVPKDGQNVKTLSTNDSKKSKFNCCWARQKIYQIKSKRDVPKHECPYTECLCCCKGALELLYKNLQEKRHANRLRRINKMLNNNVLKLTKLPASSTTVATDNTVAPCTKESSLGNQLTGFLTWKSISSTQSYVTKPFVYSPNNIESVTKSTEINKNNIECLFALNNFVSELTRIKYSDSNLIQFKKSNESANTNQNSSLGCQRSISSMCLGKNKILLTTTKFPPNLYRFQEFRRTIKHTLNLPKGIQLKLSPNGQVALYRKSNLEVSQELLEKVTDQVGQFYQRNSDDKINTNDQSKTNSSTNINHDNNQLKHSNESSKSVKHNIDQAKSTDDFTNRDSDKDAEDVTLAELIRVTKKENKTSDNVEKNSSVQLDKSNKNTNNNDVTRNTLSNLIEISGSNIADISPVIQEDIPLPLVPCSMEQQPPLRQDVDPHIADIVESRLGNIFSKALTPVTTLTELKYAYSCKGIFFKFDLQTGQLVPLNICMKRNTTREQPVIDYIEPEPVPKSIVNLSAHDLPNLAQTPLLRDVVMRNITFKELCEITINDCIENASNQLKTYNKPNLPNRTESNTTRDFLKSKQDLVKSDISNRSDISSQSFTKIEQSTQTRKLQVEKILGQRAHLSKIGDVTDPDEGNTNEVTSDNSLDDDQYLDYITENVNENNNQKSDLRLHNIALIDFVQDSNKSNFDFLSNSLDGERSLANIVENENETTNETATLLIGAKALQIFGTDTDKRNTNDVPSNNALEDERYLVKKKKNMYKKTKQQADLPVGTALREFVEDSNNSNTNDVLSDNWLVDEPSLDKIMDDVDENTKQKTKLPVRAEALRHLVNEPDISYTCNVTSDNLLVHERGLVKIMENEYRKTEQKANLPVKKVNTQFLLKTPIESNKNYDLSDNAFDGQQNINLGNDNLSCSELSDKEPLTKLLENVNGKTTQKANMPVQKVASQDCLKSRDINNTNYVLSDHSLDDEHSLIHLASVPSSSRALSDELSFCKIMDDINKKTKQNSNLPIVKVILQDIVKDSNNSNIMDVLSHDRQMLDKINNIIQSKRETDPFVGTKPLIDVVKDSNNSNIIDVLVHDRRTSTETKNVVTTKPKTDTSVATKTLINVVKDSNNSNIIDVLSHDRQTLTETKNVTTKPKTDLPVGTKSLINVVKDSNNSNIIDVLSHDRQTLAKMKNKTKRDSDPPIGTKPLINVKDSNNSNIIDVFSHDRQSLAKTKNVVKPKRDSDPPDETKTIINVVKDSNNSNIIDVLSHDRQTLTKTKNDVTTKPKTDPPVATKTLINVVKDSNNSNIIDVLSHDRRTSTEAKNVVTTKPKTDPPVGTKTLINVTKDSNNSNVIDDLSHDRQTLAKTKNVVTTKPKTDLPVGTKSLINVVKDSNNSNITKIQNKRETDLPVSTKTSIDVKNSNNSNIIEVLSHDRRTLAKMNNVVKTKRKTDPPVGTKSLINVVKDSNNSNITKIQNKRETDLPVGTKTSIDVKNSNNSNIIEVLSHDRRTLAKMNNVVKTKRKTDPPVGTKCFKDVVKNSNNGNIIDVVSDESDDEPLAKIKKLTKINNVVKTKRKTDPPVGTKCFKDVVKNSNNGNIIDVVSEDSDDEPLAKIKKSKEKSKIKTHLSCDNVAYIEIEYNDGPDKVTQTCGVIDISDESLVSLSDIECAVKKEK